MRLMKGCYRLHMVYIKNVMIFFSFFFSLYNFENDETNITYQYRNDPIL